jgi:hypothetical protein
MIKKILNFISSLFNKNKEENRLLEVFKESKTGKNLKFKDVESGEIFTNKEIKEKIQQGLYTNYIIDKNGVVKSKPGVPNLG